jgi:hypothetical protein
VHLINRLLGLVDTGFLTIKAVLFLLQRIQLAVKIFFFLYYAAFLTLKLAATFFRLTVKFLTLAVDFFLRLEQGFLLLRLAFFFRVRYNAFCFFFSGANLGFGGSLTRRITCPGTDDCCDYYRYYYFDNDNTPPLVSYLRSCIICFYG